MISTDYLRCARSDTEAAYRRNEVLNTIYTSEEQ